jgi:predicted acetyltransferase
VAVVFLWEGRARIRVCADPKRRILETRKYQAEDLGPLMRVGALALGGSVADWEKYYTESSRVELDQVYVLEESGMVRATAAVLPLEVFVGGRSAPMGGVAAVATDPAYRRRGFAGELMRAVLRGMRERGMHLSMLWPFAHVFYRAYGWELAGEAVAYTLKPTDLTTSPEQMRVRACTEEDLPRMMGLLEKEAAEHPCCVRRGEGRWREVLAREDWWAAVYEREERLEGYIQDPLVVEIQHHAPRGEPLHPYLRSSYVKAEIEPEFMLRLVDVEEALNLLDRALGEPLVLEVSDDVIEENAGSYTAGNGEVVRGVEAEMRVSLDVRQLAQLYAGYLPARQLARHGLVEPSSPAALELLGALFPVDDPWVYPPDHF